jgi:hypothetical protein
MSCALAEAAKTLTYAAGDAASFARKHHIRNSVNGYGQRKEEIYYVLGYEAANRCKYHILDDVVRISCVVAVLFSRVILFAADTCLCCAVGCYL